jgi:hypothetical protein
MNKLPLAAAWIRGSGDAVSDEVLVTLREGLESRPIKPESDTKGC